MDTEVEVARNEDILNPEVNDERIVKVIVKMRGALSQLTKEYDSARKVINDQRDMLEAELLKRLHARGATQTKTPAGTAFIQEDMQVSIADELVFQNFVRESGDLDFYQKRVSVTHLKDYQKLNNGSVPPGLNVFRELAITVRSPTK